VLRAPGVIDFRDSTRGALSIAECERGVVKCRKTLAVLTPGYIESEWTKIEAAMAQTLSPANFAGGSPSGRCSTAGFPRTPRIRC
jgi:hypothetical protein